MPSQSYKVLSDAEDDSTDKEHQRVGIEILAEGRPAAGRSALSPLVPPERLSRYRKAPGGLRPSGDLGVRVERERHPDAWAEILSWQVAEAQIL